MFVKTDDRRAFLLGVGFLLASPLIAPGAAAGKVPRVGFLHRGSPGPSQMTRERANAMVVAAGVLTDEHKELLVSRAAQALERAEHLSVWRIPAAASQAIGKLAARTMQLQCTVQDQQVWFGNAGTTVQIEPVVLKIGADQHLIRG
jgi:hypothetical protein